MKCGGEPLIFKLRDNPPVQLRCVLYGCDADDEYQVGEEIVLTSWR